MKISLLDPFENIPYFTIEGFKQVSGIEAPHTVRTLMHRWSQAGHILALKKGVYMTRRFYEQHRQDNDFSAAVSAILVPQSYLSLEFVLQEHNLLTEITYPVTCVTMGNTRTMTNPIGTFWYRNLHADLYTGFTIMNYLGIRYGRASLGKALFDYLYLRPIPASYRTAKFNLADELRLNLEEVDVLAQSEFSTQVASSGSRKMSEILNNFRSNGWLL
jgi:hypothetical protein